MFTVIVYDIQENGVRSRVAKTLKKFGERVQKSVFECELNNGQLDSLKTQLSTISFSIEDSIRFYYLEMNSVKRIETIGSSQPCINQECYFA